MKKLLLTIITLSIITLNGCYDPDTATVRINLGNIPIAKHEPKSFIDRVLGLFEKEAWAQTVYDDYYLTTVHVGAYSGNSLIASTSIDAQKIETFSCGMEQTCSAVELDIPAGENITLVVLGTTLDTGVIAYYGATEEPVTIKAGESANYSIQMNNLTSLLSSNYFNFHYEGEPVNNNARLVWNRIFGSSNYNIEYNTFQVGENYLQIYSGSSNSCLNTYYDSSNSDQYRITVRFGFTGDESDLVTFTF